MHSVPNGRSLAQVVADIKDELKDFIQTRVQLFKEEAKQKLALLKTAGILAAIAVVLLGTAYLLITVGLAALIAALLTDNPFRWVYGFFGVAVLWLTTGGIIGYLAYRQFSRKGLAPKRTFEVLRGDKLWIQAEAKDRL